MEEKEITGLSIDENISKIIFDKIADFKQFTLLLFDCLGNRNINYRLLQHNENNLSFIINLDDKIDLVNELDKLSQQTTFNYKIEDDWTNLTLVGLGFSSSPTLSSSIIKSLVQANIIINQAISTNFNYSLLVAKKQYPDAINVLVDTFKI